MNAKETYNQAWRNMRIAAKNRSLIPLEKDVKAFGKLINASQMMRNCYFGEYTATEPEYKAYVSFMVRRYNHWLPFNEWLEVFGVDGTRDEYEDFCKHIFMHFRQFIQCLESAQCGLAWANRNSWYFLINGEEHEFTNAEMGRFARYFKTSLLMTYEEFYKLMENGSEDCEVYLVKPAKGVYDRFIIRPAKRPIPTQADYAEQQADLQAEVSMQRYGG